MQTPGKVMEEMGEMCLGLGGAGQDEERSSVLVRRARF